MPKKWLFLRENLPLDIATRYLGNENYRRLYWRDPMMNNCPKEKPPGSPRTYSFVLYPRTSILRAKKDYTCPFSFSIRVLWQTRTTCTLTREEQRLTLLLKFKRLCLNTEKKRVSLLSDRSRNAKIRGMVSDDITGHRKFLLSLLNPRDCLDEEASPWKGHLNWFHSKERGLGLTFYQS